MKILRLLAQLLAMFVVMVAAIWAYDTYKSKKVAQEQQQVAALTETNNRVRSLQISYISYGLQALAGFRVQVAENFMENGKLPSSNEAAGLRSPESYRSELITAINVEPGGAVKAHFASSFPGTTNAWIKTVPDAVTEGMPLNWKCVSNITEIASFSPNCTFANE